ncbi:hypothetical protein [Dyadobacter sp. CY323]|uniref:hypothetical protein n=1 Tax=Dyadobacter sp. CY323 TaxID=2907302 RepID=UPI001F3F5E20|nr:hypothetical protein [Dyadobacter sp. CY323]MCE6987486.1 hypothetical protein [Dyadobacter sp. CY323]
MAAITSFLPWEPIPLNQSGIRRLKIVNSDRVSILRPDIELIPVADLVFYEFIFPNDLACIASFQRRFSGSGAAYWVASVSFTLPHINNQIISWVANNPTTEWLLIAEDYNGHVRVIGGDPTGLIMEFQSTTGAGPGAQNPMVFSFSAEQIFPFVTLPEYENEALFPDSEFDFSFDFSFT